MQRRYLFIQILLAVCVFAQGSYRIDTVAGQPVRSGVLATSRIFASPQGLFVDAANNLYIGEVNGNRVDKINTATGIATIIAGNGVSGVSGDGGPARNAMLTAPRYVAADAGGNLYIADADGGGVSCVVRRVDGITGVITTYAGTAGHCGYNGDGIPATSAQFGAFIRGLALDKSGNLYVADSTNARLRRIDAVTHIITTVAGTGVNGFTGDNGPAINAQIQSVFGPAFDSVGNLYFGTSARIRRVDTKGIITTYAGTGNGAYNGEGLPATQTNIGVVRGLTFDSFENLYYVDSGNTIDRVREIHALNQTVTTIAGNGNVGYTGDGGPALNATLNAPQGVAVDSNGNVYLSDFTGNNIRKVTAGIISTFAGSNGPENVAPTLGLLNYPAGLSFSPAGNLFIADELNGRIREVDAAFTSIKTIAGIGYPGFGGDGGPALMAGLGGPLSVATDPQENYYIADSSGEIRFVNQNTGIISDFAGNANVQQGYSGDNGPATAATLSGPTGVALDPSGTIVYIADQFNNVIRKVANGVITTVAGNGTAGFAGDGGPAISAELNQPQSVKVDALGNVFIADIGNNRIRELKFSDKTIVTVAGNGIAGYSGDGGVATAAAVSSPADLAVDAAGNVFIADTGNHVIRRVSTSGIITTIADNGTAGLSGDGGPATAAQFAFPQGIAVDGSGIVYVSDLSNGVIRRLTPASVNVEIGLPAVSAQGNCIPFGCPGLFGLTEFQQVYASTAFSGPITIGQITFLNTQDVQGIPITPANYQFRLSTTSKTVGDLDATTLANNVGLDDQLFFSGSLSGTLPQNQLTITGTPFVYNPANGNLLLTVLITGAGSDTQLSLDQAGAVPAVTERIYAPNGSAPAARGTGLVTQFSPAPTVATGTSLSPSSLGFGNQVLQTTSGSQSVTLTSTGNATLTISSIQLTGTNPNDFAQSNSCASSLPPGQTCVVNVKFTPGATGARSANLSIADNAGGSPQLVPLTGNGAPVPPSPAAKVTLSPSTITLGNQFVGTVSQAMPVTLTNAGTAILNLVSISFTGTTNADFGQTNNCGTTVAANGGHCTIMVTFNPSSPANGTAPPVTESGLITVTGDQSNGPQSIRLSGIGVFPVVDTDGDGIPDVWETQGLTLNGIFVDLPSMGADPNRKDIFVQVDHLACNTAPCQVDPRSNLATPTHDHTPNLDAMKLVIAAFDKQGINLHVDWGQNAIMTPARGHTWADCLNDTSEPPNPAMCATWGRLSQANTIAENNTNFDLGCTLSAASQCTTASIITSFGALKNAASMLRPVDSAFSQARRPVFHYGIFGHAYRSSSSPATDNSSGSSMATTQSSGPSLTEPSSDLLVTLGLFDKTDYQDVVGRVSQQAGSFMHELGHNLGLNHGGPGADTTLYKPNYLSVMNYSFQTQGLIVNDPGCAAPCTGHVDYSQLQLTDLDETALVETQGLAGTNGSLANSIQNYGTEYFCPDMTERFIPPPPGAPNSTDMINGPILWDCNANNVINTSKVSAPINQGPENSSKVLGTLHGYADWPSLLFKGGQLGTLGLVLFPTVTSQSVHAPEARAVAAVDSSSPELPPELTADEDSMLTTVRAVSVVGTGNLTVPPAGSTVLTFTITNKGITSDTYIISASTDQPWADLSGVPSQVILAPDATTQFTIPVTVPASVGPGVMDHIVVKAISLANPLVLDSARPTVVTPSADLAVAIAASPSPAHVGQPLTYTITVTNHGPDPNTNVVLTDALPAAVTLSSAMSTNGACSGSQAVTCSLGDLASYSSATITLAVVPTTAATLSNTVSVAGAVADPILVNNTTLVSVGVLSGAGAACGANDVDSVVAVSRSPFHYISPSHYEYSQTITVTNAGSSTIPAPIHLVVDELSGSTGAPAYLVGSNQLVTHCGSPNGSYLVPVTVAGGALAPGQSGQVQLVTATSSGSTTYTTRVFSGTPNQ